MKQQRGSAGAVLALIVGLVVFASSALIIYIQHKPAAGTAAPPPAGPEAAAPTEDPDTLTFVRRTDPPRTVVQDAHGDAVAVFTDGARTVRVTGPTRTFVEPAFTKRSVVTDAWIRLAPVEWSAGSETASWFAPWLTAARADRKPDVFGAAMQYVHDAPAAKDAAGIRYAGDASFGPLSATDPDGREERSDFLDYLGVPWTFPDGGRKQPQKDRFGAVDCSGFVRLVYGYRMGYPLRFTNNPGPGLPRRAFAMASVGPGVLVIPNKGKPSHDFGRLQPGDLVFFDTESGNGDQTDHSGIYMGLDDAGHHRFISSRSRADGPTFGDLGGDALLDGGGYWSIRFRTARRI